jgi:hypothetical protein
LEALPVAQNPYYLTDVIFPLLPKAMRQGTQYYSDIQADVSAQTGRTAGNAPTENTIADQQTTFNLENDEFIDREKVPDGDIAGLGGLDAAQMKAARKAKRAVGNAVEDLTAANILANGSVTYTGIGSSLIRAVGTGVDTLLDYEGVQEVALVISSRLFHMIKTYTEVQTSMAYTGVPITDLRDVRGVKPDQVAATLGVNRILVGNNTQWYDQNATYQSRAALVALPNASVEPDEVVQVGRTLWFSATGSVPSAEDLFEVHSWYSEDKLSEMVDCRAYAEQKVFNVEHIYGLAGIDGQLTS